VLLALLPPLGLTLYTVAEERREEAAAVQATATGLAQLLAAGQEQWVEATRQLLATLAEEQAYQDDDEGGCSGHLARLRSQYPAYANLGIVGLDGEVRCSAVPFSGPVSVADRAYFRRALETRDFAVGEYQVGRITRQPALNFGYPLVGEAGQIEGVVFASLHLGWFERVAARAPLPEGAVLLIVDRNGTVLFRYPQGEQWAGKSLLDAPLTQAILAGETGAREATGLDGMTRLYAFSPVTHDGEAVAYAGIGVSTAAALGPANRLLVRNLSLMALTALASLAATRLVGEVFLLRPVKALVDATRRLAAGDLSARTGIRRGAAELVELAQAFDGTVEVLRQREAERKQAEAAVLEINGRLRQALADVSEREATIRRQAERQHLLNEFARSVSSTLDLRSIFTLAVEHVAGVMRCHWCAILRHDAPGRRFHVAIARAADGSTAWQPEATLPDGSAWGRALRTGAPCVAGGPDGAQDTGGLDGRDGPGGLDGLAELSSLGDGRTAGGAALGRGIQSLVCVPIMIGDGGWGVLAVGFADRQAATAECVEFLSALASHLGAGIKNAQLYSDLHAALAELRATQQQVIRQERLRALGEMASGIAHDFNNALAPVLGFSELLLTQPGDLADEEKVRRYLELIHTGARDAATVVKRLRDFYRQREAGEAFLPVDLNRLIEQAMALTQPRWKGQAQAGGRTIRIETELQPLPPVPANEGELREVLTNLIFNAVDAMPDGGTITLRTYLEEGRRTDDERRSAVKGSHSSLVLGPSSGDGWVVLEVADTGVGMSEEAQRRCLEPFFTTKGQHGTGLGLSMVYGIVQRHGGTLTFESAVGRGTTFRIRLPLRAEWGAHAGAGGRPGGALEPAGTGLRPLRPLRVLLVDDEPAARSVAAAYLTSDGHMVQAAAGGPEAVAQVQAGRFDVVLTDRAMPGMSGDQVAAAVKAVAPSTPVVLLTGFGDLMAAAGERPPGVDAIVGKPVTLAKLREALALVAPTPGE
jgi:signal transduction histidine kinase/CheY-like chemotaxis protein